MKTISKTAFNKAFNNYKEYFLMCKKSYDYTDKKILIRDTQHNYYVENSLFIKFHENGEIDFIATYNVSKTKTFCNIYSIYSFIQKNYSDKHTENYCDCRFFTREECTQYKRALKFKELRENI